MYNVCDLDLLQNITQKETPLQTKLNIYLPYFYKRRSCMVYITFQDDKKLINLQEKF